ncbi:hypothetical protein Vadar_033495 [Vaccinium darrowii]|uniref:Uncharacterized protein n=1 Tax=Vaccinium darrowii TaxID=229202 RepID=A0ACB7ZGA4_9ERIC|nr:hypothetical protein Vadar_033495 [Vaccinium darrowii]
MHLASAKWTRRVGFKPRIDAVHMEAVVAFGQFPAPLAAGNIVKAHCAVKGVHFARIWLEGEEVLVATTPFEQEIDDEEEDDHNGEDCWVVCFGGECWKVYNHLTPKHLERDPVASLGRLSDGVVSPQPSLRSKALGSQISVANFAHGRRCMPL